MKENFNKKKLDLLLGNNPVKNGFEQSNVSEESIKMNIEKIIFNNLNKAVT